MAEQRKPRWFQFSLRALLLFVLLVSIGMSWLAVKLQRARQQRETVEEVAVHFAREDGRIASGLCKRGGGSGVNCPAVT